jgi:hypothetical protein
MRKREERGACTRLAPDSSFKSLPLKNIREQTMKTERGSAPVRSTASLYHLRGTAR